MYTLLGRTNKFASENLGYLNLKLFDRVILPICTYNNEVRGITYFHKRFVPGDVLGARQLKNVVGKLHCTFIK